MKTLASRVNLAIKERGCTPGELAHAAGVKAPSVSDWINGETKKLQLMPGILAAKFLNVSVLWLAEGIGNMHDPLLTPTVDFHSTPETKDPAIADLASLLPDVQTLLQNYQTGGAAKQEALKQLAALPEHEMSTMILLLKSIGSKYEAK